MFTYLEALEAIKNKPEFKVIQKDGYVVIDYQITTPDTFKGATSRETMILQNLRGTAFNVNTGKIVSLPFQKFHNLGECDGYMPNQIDFSKAESVMLKLDGSMIRAIRTYDSWVFGTRAGETDVSALVDNWLVSLPKEARDAYVYFIDSCVSYDLTPIFEFTSRANKVVIDYPTTALTLLAIRNNSTGMYADRATLVSYSLRYGIPLVEEVKDFTPDNVRAWKNAEGVVVSFADGFRVKIKADEYVRMHRAKDLIRFEKDVVKMILENSLDDVLPLVSEEDRVKLSVFNWRFTEKVNGLVAKMAGDVITLSYEYPVKKDFALVIKDRIDKSFLFRLYDGKDSGFVEALISACSSGPRIEEMLVKFQLPRWNNIGVVTNE